MIEKVYVSDLLDGKVPWPHWLLEFVKAFQAKVFTYCAPKFKRRQIAIRWRDGVMFANDEQAFICDMDCNVSVSQ